MVELLPREAGGLHSQKSRLCDPGAVHKGCAQLRLHAEDGVHPRMPVIELRKIRQSRHLEAGRHVALSPYFQIAARREYQHASLADDDGHV
jgi:hypothetical protein